MVDEPEVSIDVGIEELKKQLEAAKREKVAAENKAREAANNANSALSDKRDSDMLLIDGAIAEMERNDTILLQGLAEANATGEWGKAAEIQREILLNAGKLERLKDGKDRLEATPVPKMEEAEIPTGDPVEEFAKQLTPKAAAWIREHPECITDPKMNRRLVAAHNLAETTPGVVSDSPEYFAIIEKTLYPDQGDPVSEAGKPVPARTAPSTAPVSRGSSNGNGRATLSKAQREMAAELGIPEEEYASDLNKLREEGRIAI